MSLKRRLNRVEQVCVGPDASPHTLIVSFQGTGPDAPQPGFALILSDRMNAHQIDAKPGETVETFTARVEAMQEGNAA